MDREPRPAAAGAAGAGEAGEAGLVTVGVHGGSLDSAAKVADVLRRRIISAVRSALLFHGERLQSVREVSRQLGIDPRVALAAYRMLADEGLVEMRPRSGVYVAVRNDPAGRLPVLAEGWVVDLLAQGIGREISAVELPEWLRRCVDTLRLRAVAIGGSHDAPEGISGELREDYGFDATPVLVEHIGAESSADAFRRADLVVCTPRTVDHVRAHADRIRGPLVVAEIRADLIAAEWRRMLQRQTYAVVADERFEPLLQGLFAGMDDGGTLRVLVAGRDDLAAIPRTAPVYVTRAARARLRAEELPPYVVTTARIFSEATARELLTFIVRANLEVLDALPG